MTAVEGCTRCGSAAIETIDGVAGRRCPHCPPTFSAKHYDGQIADGQDPTPYLRTLGGSTYRPDFAEHLVELGRAEVAFVYLATSLAREIDRRFTAVVLP